MESVNNSHRIWFIKAFTGGLLPKRLWSWGFKKSPCIIHECKDLRINNLTSLAAIATKIELIPSEAVGAPLLLDLIQELEIEHQISFHLILFYRNRNEVYGDTICKPYKIKNGPSAFLKLLEFQGWKVMKRKTHCSLLKAYVDGVRELLKSKQRCKWLH